MSKRYTLIDNTQDKERHFDSEDAAKDNKAFLVSEGHDVELIDTQDTQADGGDVPTPEPAEFDTPDTSNADSGLDQLGESLGQDPLEILPGHMIDQIQGQPAINKRGYAMIAERYGISVQSFIESYPWDNEDNRCVARAVATTEDGREYQDYATAKADDGDMPEQLVELASTRALKRVVSWSSGVGIISYQELAGELEDTR